MMMVDPSVAPERISIDPSEPLRPTVTRTSVVVLSGVTVRINFSPFRVIIERSGIKRAFVREEVLMSIFAVIPDLMRGSFLAK